MITTGIPTLGIGKRITNHLQMKSSLAEDTEFFRHNDQYAASQAGKERKRIERQKAQRVNHRS